MIWFLNDPARVDMERRAIEDLQRRVDWLDGAAWRLAGSAIVLDVNILAAGRIWPVTLSYPYVYPTLPPSVNPRDTEERWSGHQYGPGGELCLEWGADNWYPALTGADMLESAYRLLSTENGVGDDGAGTVESRHRTTFGQDLRSRRYRFVVTASLADRLRTISTGSDAAIAVRLVFRDSSTMALVTEVGRAPADAWVDPSVPKALNPAWGTHKGKVFRFTDDWSRIECQSISACRLDLSACGFVIDEDDEFVLLIIGADIQLVWFIDLEADRALTFETILVQDDGLTRLGVNYAVLADKRVGIVGLGSVGSKLAVSLARSGVNGFVLVDDDLVLPGNLVRNDLDWRDVGDHKVDAAARRIQLANPGAVCRTHRLRINGQEASGYVASVIRSLSGCDVIVDATADARTFNVLSAVVSVTRKPLVWTETFGGGIGGMVARHRPGLDPEPQTMRARFLAWCAEQDVEVPKSGDAYSVEAVGGLPMLADDADVSVISAHTTRCVLDILLRPGASLFPYPIYVVGMKPGWIFNQPFETWPIDVGMPEPKEDAKPDWNEHQETVRFLVDLMAKTDNAPSAPAPNS